MRTVSLDLVKPGPVEYCNPRGDHSFADALKATLAETDAATRDGSAPSQSDFEAAIAMLGALTAPVCAPGAPPEALGLAREPSALDEEPSLPGASQPVSVPGDQRIFPIPGDIALFPPPPMPPAIGDGIEPSPAPPLPPPAAPVSPIGDAHVLPTAPTVPLSMPVVTPVVAQAVAQVVPTVVADITPADVATERPDLTGQEQSRDTNISSDTTVASAATTGMTPPPTDGESSRVRRDALPQSDDSGMVAADASANAGAQVIAAAASNTASGTRNEVDAKVARAVVQLPGIVSDLAQQARTESSPRRVVIPLDPPALGHVTVEIIVRADSVKVSLQHGDEAAFNALNAQRPAIQAALESNGLHLSGFDVSGNQQQRAPHTRTAARHFEAFVEQVEPDGALRL